MSYQYFLVIFWLYLAKRKNKLSEVFSSLSLFLSKKNQML